MAVRALALALAVLLGASCSEGPYILGSVGIPPARYCAEGADCRGRFELPLSRAGTGVWGDRVIAGGVSRTPALVLRGEDASASRWLPRTGGALVARDARTGTRGPFTDATRAAETSSAFVSEGELARFAGADVLVEVVLRAAPDADVLRAVSASRALTISSDASGALSLSIGAGGAASVLSTRALVEGAWYHVIFELHDRQPSAVHVNAVRADAPSVVRVGGEEGHAITVGGRGEAAIAWLAVVPWGDVALDASASLERFAQLTGVVPSVAGGAPLPTLLERDSVAFVDLVEDAGARRLHLVGEHWPRIACRPDASGAVFCGYLVEAGTARFDLPFDVREARVLRASVEELARERSVGAHVPMIAVRGTAEEDTHGVGAEIGGGGTLVISFFARLGSAHEVELHVDGLGDAQFDTTLGTARTAEVFTVSIEPFGAGLARCTVVARDLPDARRAIEVRAVIDRGARFVGDGSVLFEVGGLQLEGNRVSATSLVHVGGRAEDRLVFSAMDNVPADGTGHIRARVLAQRGERIHDQAVVNVSRAASPDDQLNLYVSTPGNVLFVGSDDGVIEWLLPNDTVVSDGLAADIEASWAPGVARLVVRGVEARADVDGSVIVADHDRLAIGWTGSTSGVADGLVGEIGLGP